MLLFDLLKRIVRDASGQAIVEGSIVTVIVILLLAGGIEFGNMFLTYGTATKSMRDATRYLARLPEADVAAVCSNAAELVRATHLAMYGSFTNTDPITGNPLQPLIRNWANSNTITSTCVSNSITLQAAVPYTPLIFTGIPFTSIRFNRDLTVQHQEPWIGN